ncbi:hypothetical protein [Kamptonema sp. UHCC 0994]|uniref:hypothetical protein n=1 Tax=Kamptonema sp. UHCC 0994 TaxID=3031329 RepID=UPI0023BA718A|nr:hypothetical protein [Kamptonema sp. UHCC 0994]MDF0556414.1 hypothetical protein [Kamptonema sp. UHCC 0994]
MTVIIPDFIRCYCACSACQSINLITKFLRKLTLDRPPLLSIAVQRQSSQQLINNDNRDRVGESAERRTLPPLPVI